MNTVFHSVFCASAICAEGDSMVFIQLCNEGFSRGHSASGLSVDDLLLEIKAGADVTRVMIWLFNKSLSYLLILSYLEGHILSGRSHLILEG